MTKRHVSRCPTSCGPALAIDQRGSWGEPHDIFNASAAFAITLIFQCRACHDDPIAKTLRAPGAAAAAAATSSASFAANVRAPASAPKGNIA